MCVAVDSAERRVQQSARGREVGVTERLTILKKASKVLVPQR